MFGLVRESRLKGLQKEYDELKRRLDKAKEVEKENTVLSLKIADLTRKKLELEKQIREQTEADLFFVSAKIQKKLLDGEPKESVDSLRLQQIGYQAQLAQMQQQNPLNPFNSMCSALSNPLGWKI